MAANLSPSGPGEDLELPLASADQPAAQGGRADEEDSEEGDRAGNRLTTGRLEPIEERHHGQRLGKPEQQIAPGSERPQ
jgi:hypothetical protein